MAEQVRAFAAAGHRPGLAVVLAGEDHASAIYVRSKIKACQEVGIHSEEIIAPGSVNTSELLAEVARLNRRDDIDGILVQLPLPPQVDSQLVLLAVDPEKDVDGFHPVNVGKLATQRPTLCPVHSGGSHGNLAQKSHCDCRQSRRRRGEKPGGGPSDGSDAFES